MRIFHPEEVPKNPPQCHSEDRLRSMRRNALATFIMLCVLCLVMMHQDPVAGQLIPPNKDAVSLSIATFQPFVVLSRVSYGIAHVWDVTFI